MFDRQISGRSQSEGGAEFDSQWSWILLAKKIDGAWLHAGNASNRLQ